MTVVPLAHACDDRGGGGRGVGHVQLNISAVLRRAAALVVGGHVAGSSRCRLGEGRCT